MGSSGMPTLDSPPPQPPDTSGQMGASPYAGASSMLAQKAQGGQSGSPDQPNPRGALVTMSDAIKKVLDQMAKMESSFSPFGDRIRSLLDAGVGSVMSGGAPGGTKDGSITSPSQKPGEMGAQAPGSGFPG